MIETTRFEDVTQIRMSREIGGVPVYWVSSYLIDDSVYLVRFHEKATFCCQ